MEYVIKKKLAALALCLLLVMSVVLCGCSQNVEANKNRKINSVNHRGYGDAPENTLSAYRLSKRNGVYNGGMRRVFYKGRSSCFAA